MQIYMSTDAQSAELPELEQPQLNHTTADPRSHSRSGRALLKKKPRAKLQRGKQAETSAQREKPNARPQRGKQADTSAQREKPIARPQRGKQARPSAQQKKPNAGLHRGKQARTSTQREKPRAGLAAAVALDASSALAKAIEICKFI